VILWLDAQLPPQLAPWLSARCAITALALRDLGLRGETDEMIFRAAREQGAVIMTKDRDFVTLVERYGSPPQVIWLTCGNTTNLRLQTLLLETWSPIAELLAAQEQLIEVRDR
jgi:predicted nuclease of predicted toxin-antitoxin system